MIGLFKNYIRIIRFAVSGSIVAFVALSSLYLLTDVLHIWYLTSSVISFLLGLTVNFILQQYWTFKDHGTDGKKKKAVLFFVNALFNLLLNTALMYVLVDVVYVWYFLAQAIVMVLLSIMNYVVYRYIIFCPEEKLKITQKA